MKIKRSKVLWASAAFILSSIVLMTPSSTTSWNMEFAIFNLKMGVALFAMFVCMEKE